MTCADSWRTCKVAWSGAEKQLTRRAPGRSEHFHERTLKSAALEATPDDRRRFFPSEGIICTHFDSIFCIRSLDSQETYLYEARSSLFALDVPNGSIAGAHVP
jgi:hypothetical protein